ncbi:hepatocellular carcinoma-associated antigen 59-domain-containing protein [Epithele typhae]|uniref:hepatocellular carcinoma-associated antigen 59-domain-containing protein n=1 Tax=Epithele typhae TaxID=378194 RepID=UPI00200877EF|nr:hepatocellular carcinoma-associated antigen 59-domain-containing protein [Epithele typhae]KAH9943205.1 hepatocellular carcinoma-associated antigen 59-domain-containing protein [Epithele typhae]
MFKKRSRPQPRARKAPAEDDEHSDSREEAQQEVEKLDVAELIELRKLRKAREGINVAKLSTGDTKKKRKRPKEEEEVAYGLQPGAPTHDDDDEDAEDAETKTRKVVRANNFTQQTNALDVDKHMMAYIEENMKARRGTTEKEEEESGPADPYAELFRLNKTDKKEEEGNVTNSLAMLTAIPEVDLGMDTRLKNIEETEKAKRQMSEARRERTGHAHDEAHLAAARFYRPNLKAKSDADIIRDAKLEAMGLRPEDHEHRRGNSERAQMATDEIVRRTVCLLSRESSNFFSQVMERFKKRMRK